jgi:Secretion system C-terminal sorting domain/Metallo-peptidase family M12
LERISNYQKVKHTTVVSIASVPLIHQNGVLTFTLPNRSEPVSIKLKRLEITDADNYLASGTNEDFAFLLLIKKEGITFGSIKVDGIFYEVCGINEKISTIIEFEKDVTKHGCGTQDKKHEIDIHVDPNTNSPTPETIVPCAENEIDVLVFFSARAQSRQGDIFQLAHNAVQQYNHALVDSEIFNSKARLKIVGIELLPNYTETQFGEMGREFLKFQRTNVEGSVAAKFSERRDLLRPDIVVVLTAGDFRNGEIGLALEVDVETSRKDNAIAIVETVTAMSHFVLAHEVGHLLGGQHQLAKTPNRTTSHGRTFVYRKSLNGKNRVAATIMCTELASADRIGMFTSPTARFWNATTGDATQHNVAGKITTSANRLVNFQVDPNSFFVDILGARNIVTSGNYTWEPFVSCPQGAFTTTWAATLNGVNLAPVVVQNDGTYSLYVDVQQGISGLLTLSITVRDNAGRVRTGFRTIPIDGTNPIEFHNSSQLDKGFSKTEQQTEVQLYPNPTQSLTNIIYYLPQNSNVEISIYDAAGRIIRSIDKGIQSNGVQNETIDCSNLTSGIYMCLVATNQGKFWKKLTIQKNQ